MAEGPEQRAQRRVGTMVRDKYRIDAFIATGSMANVYAATHRNGSRVALKILHNDLARDASMSERFRREGYFANAIGHPGVVRAIDDDIAEDGCVFIVMELLEGENLEQRRQRLGGKIPLPEVLQIADAMLDVLSAAHDHEVLHRDLKPENVFVTRKNEVKLLDFGVARFNDGRRSSEMTAAGMVLGTPAFMPPEQALGRREDVDVRSDIWGVGATLFTVLTGESVHAGGDAKSKLIATARTPARPLRDVAPHIPRPVASVIDRALAFDKAKRWADANAMREALRWARMSLDEDVASRLEQLGEVEPPPIPTRRTGEDDPTLAGRSFDSTQARTTMPSFDDSTAKRPPASIDVFTSVAPVTQRDVPPSMVTSDRPTFPLRSAQDDALRRAPESVPATERLPQHVGSTASAVDRNPGDLTARPGAQLGPSLDTAAILRAALANTALAVNEGSDARTLPRFDSRAAGPDVPRPAAGAPLDVTPRTGSASSARVHLPTTSSSVRTVPGIGVSRAEVFSPDAPAAQPRAYPSAPPTTTSSFPPNYPSAAPAPATSSFPPNYPSAAPAPATSSFPPRDAPASPYAHPSSPPAPGIPRTIRGRPSVTPESPGPLLSTIVPKKHGVGTAVLVPILIGVLAGVTTYVLVSRQRAASASHPVATVEDAATPLSSVPAITSAQPMPGVSASASATPAASATSTVTTPPATTAAPAASSAPSPKKPRGKPRAKPPTPAAPGTSTTSTVPESTAPESPAPVPAPTPIDSLPSEND